MRLFFESSKEMAYVQQAQSTKVSGSTGQPQNSLTPNYAYSRPPSGGPV
ncbi:hypothetical protein [Spirosoma litoris]